MRHAVSARAGTPSRKGAARGPAIAALRQSLHGDTLRDLALG